MAIRVERGTIVMAAGMEKSVPQWTDFVVYLCSFGQDVMAVFSVVAGHEYGDRLGRPVQSKQVAPDAIVGLR